VKLRDVIGRRYGEKIKSSLGVDFTVLKPSIYDYVMKFSRRTQIMYAKDMALILMFSGVGPGSRIVEAGTGTGALTSVLAHYVKPTGKVYSYEVRAEFLENAKRNLERAKVSDYVELKNKDILKGVDEVDVDAVILDMATPWLAVPHISGALKGGGSFASFSPTIEQVIKTVEALELEGFTSIETIECITRRFQVKAGQTRPETLMVGHTGYLTFARKTLKCNTNLNYTTEPGLQCNLS
jgi:tRNA (adenine57-N1/adenine58-N1)-methyltransferase